MEPAQCSVLLSDRARPVQCAGARQCPAAIAQLRPRPLLLVVLRLLQEARRAVGGGVKVQYVSLNKDSHVLEVPEVSPGWGPEGGGGEGDRAWGRVGLGDSLTKGRVQAAAAAGSCAPAAAVNCALGTRLPDPSSIPASNPATSKPAASALPSTRRASRCRAAGSPARARRGQSVTPTLSSVNL